MLIELDNTLHLVGQATLVTNERDLAWAERAVKHDPAKAWILGRYVEADNPNQNKQMWSLADLRESRSTINGAPLNLLHHAHRIVGHFADNELLYPTEAAGDDQSNPYIEALAVFYKYYFQQEHALIAKAHDAGSLFFSMESVCDTLTCTGDGGCGESFEYDGVDSATYCEHLTTRSSTRLMNKPHFLAGALIYPPTRPGWRNAEIKDISAMIEQAGPEVEKAYETVATIAPHLEPAEWEALMGRFLSAAKKMNWKSSKKSTAEEARKVSTDERKKLADTKKAMPDGAYPIANVADLKNAIQAIGRAKPSEVSAVKAHIKRRAKALGAQDLIPDSW